MDRKESVQTALVHLLQKGSISLPILLFTEYKQIGISEQELMLLIHIWIYQEKEQKPFPTVSELEERMNIKSERIVEIIEQLVRGGYLEIEHGIDDRGIRCERFSLVPLLQQLASSFMEKQAEGSEEPSPAYENVFQLFEKEFGRPLSPMECQMLAQWLDEDGHSEELIEAALREAVFCGKLNFRYIDRILFEWQRNHVRTADEAVEYSRKFRQKGMLYQTSVKEKSVDPNRRFSFYNWVNQQP